MKSMGAQLIDILVPRQDQLNRVASPQVAELVKSRMLENTQSGKAFGNDPYNNIYSAQYAKRRKAGQRSPVTLRDTKMSIEKYVVTASTRSDIGSTIELPSDPDRAKIFRFHHEGTARGGKTRSIFPKTAASVSPDIRDEAKRLAKGVLNGSLS